MSCFKSNKTLCNCDATVLLNVSILLVFVGKGYLALVPSHLPHLRRLGLDYCRNLCDKSVEDLVAAVPELIVSKHKVYQHSNEGLEQIRLVEHLFARP